MSKERKQYVPKPVPPGVIEQWKPLNYNGEIYPRYMVSDYGKVIDTLTNEHVSTFHMRGEYWYFDVNPGSHHCAIHRAIIMTFYPINHFREMQVNHKNGDPEDNRLCNLEWVTGKGNTIHAIRMGLSKIHGTDNGHSKYELETIHKVCFLLKNGLTPAQIANEFGIFEKKERDTFCANVSAIRSGRIHREIAEMYGLLDNNKHREYTGQDAHWICLVLQDDGDKITCKELMDMMFLPNEYRLDFLFFLQLLLNKKKYKPISDLYELQKPRDYDEIAKIKRYNPQRLEKAIYS